MGVKAMAALITAIMLWLSVNFDLPVTSVQPQIQFVPPVRMAALRHRGFDIQPQTAAVGPDMNTVSVFDTDRRIIYLPQTWTGNTAAELSMLVHELVHYLQAVSGEKFACVEAREKTAFEAQERWLALFGTDLTREFQIDPFAVLVRTNCPP